MKAENFKKKRHASLGVMPSKKFKFDKEEKEDINDAINPHWESYCGACDRFDTPQCPHYGKVVNITRWKVDIVCKYFND